MYLGSLFRTLRPILRTTNLSGHGNPLILRYLCSDIGKKDLVQDQFTVSYLVNSCGLSLESAKLASQRVHLKTLDKPNAILSLLKSCGFSQAQISKLVGYCPALLLSSPEKTVLPKIEFLRSKGFSDPEIARIISGSPYLLHRSLANHIVPAYDYLKSVCATDDKAVAAIKQNTNFITWRVEGQLVRNFDILREYGVPDSSIGKLVSNWPVMLLTSSERLKQLVEELRDRLGMDPSRYVFVQALAALAGITKSRWESKVSVFKKWSLSEEQVLVGFRAFPRIMSTSEDKIVRVMELLVHQLGWEPSIIVKYPVLLGMSLEKRLIPRASVLQHLVLKHSMKKEYVRPTMFILSDEKFLNKYVNHHPEAPELLKLFGNKPAVS